MPTVDKTTHIGIQRSNCNTQLVTAEENIKKARRALDSLIASGLHGENGIDPSSSISTFRTYVMPILLYGLDVVMTNSKSLKMLQAFYKKMIKQILSLPISTADPAIYLLSGLLPINAEIDIKIITLLGNILCSDKSTVEWKIANRQLKIKSCKSNNPVEFLDTITTKETWEKSMVNKIKIYWHRKILDEKEHFNSLQYLSPIDSLGHCHPLASISASDPKIVQKLPPRVKISTGGYILQSQRAKYNYNAVDPTCQLCKNGEETLSHIPAYMCNFRCCKITHIRKNSDNG
ncbi:unnamed protein product [Mytilus coruscus]|uniref:Uncharacterized protein n=1 Tax=Mytilus coruscus TaxID=42192 RepID=A0A6J8AU53_MYTCO|nr:unnamed protein product [Mytilus coruscus]